MIVELLDKKKVAGILGISIVTLDRLRKSRALPYRKVGSQVRFLPEDIQAYLGACRPRLNLAVFPYNFP